MVDILDEANQDYTFHKRVSLFKKALPFIALFTVIVVVVIGLRDWYSNKKLSERELATSILAEALESIDPELKQEALLSIANAKDGISDIAQQNLITGNITKSDINKALSQLEQLSQNGSSIITQNLAKLEYVGLLLDKNELTDQDSRKIQNILLSIDQTQVMYSKAQIYLALYNIKIGNYTSAKDIIIKLKNTKKLPEFIHLEADAILNYINEKENK